MIGKKHTNQLNCPLTLTQEMTSRSIFDLAWPMGSANNKGVTGWLPNDFIAMFPVLKVHCVTLQWIQQKNLHLI